MFDSEGEERYYKSMAISNVRDIKKKLAAGYEVTNKEVQGAIKDCELMKMTGNEEQYQHYSLISSQLKYYLKLSKEEV